MSGPWTYPPGPEDRRCLRCGRPYSGKVIRTGDTVTFRCPGCSRLSGFIIVPDLTPVTNVPDWEIVST